MSIGERKKLLYRSKHRGCKEIDILLGEFASEYLFKLNNEELLQFKEIVAMDDELIYEHFKKEELIENAIPLIRKIVEYAKEKFEENDEED